VNAIAVSNLRPTALHRGRGVVRSRRIKALRPFRQSLLVAIWLGIVFGGPCSAQTIHPLQDDFYVATDHLPLEARIHPAPEPVVQLAFERNAAMGMPVLPKPASPGHPLVPTLVRMLRELPAQIRQMAEASVKAVYLVDGNFGSARTEAVRDLTGRVVGGYMILNAAALARTANEWISWREHSAFRTQGPLRVKVTLEPPATDNQQNALRFLFLHELGHILGMVSGTHGYWAAPETFWLTERSAFTNLSWRLGNDGLFSPWKHQYPLLGQLGFYRFEKAPLATHQAPQVYAALARTDLPSLYGSVDPYEDFAESFALFVHTELLNRPYYIELFEEGRLIGRFRSCLQDGRCPQKIRLIAALIERWRG